MAGRDPEDLIDMLYNELIELQWLVIAEDRAIADFQERSRPKK